MNLFYWLSIKLHKNLYLNFLNIAGSLTVYGYNNNRSPSISLLGVQSSIVCNSDYWIMEITKDGSYLWFTAISTTSAPVLWIVNIGGPASTMKWYTQLSSGIYLSFNK